MMADGWGLAGSSSPVDGESDGKERKDEEGVTFLKNPLSLVSTFFLYMCHGYTFEISYISLSKTF